MLRRAWIGARPVRLRALRVDVCLVVLAVPGELDASDAAPRRIGGDAARAISDLGHAADESWGVTQRGEALMPGWLLWTLVGIGAWLVASVPFALLAGRLLGRRRVLRRRVVMLAAPGAIRVRARGRSWTLTRSG